MSKAGALKVIYTTSMYEYGTSQKPLLGSEI